MATNDDEYPPVDIQNFQHLDLVSIHEAVVMLEFYDGNKKNMGTGFFVNIPDSRYEVILTAGHNLYTKSNTFMTPVTVLLPKSPFTINIPPEHVKVSAEYMKDRNNREADYGVILIPRTAKERRPAFGFNMIHSFSELRGEVNVSCYRGSSKPGRPVLSTGVVLTNESTEAQLVYKAKTEQGNSGSPVWIAYENDAAVVAVHNNKPATESSGSRGSRISPKLLFDVFTWAELDTKKKIRAQNISKHSKNPAVLPPEGLFMVFGQRPFARLQRGTGTEFDVLPAKVTSDGVQYVLALDDKWVTFNIEDGQAILVDKPRGQSLFNQQPMSKPALNPGVVYVYLSDKKHQLRMDGSKFKPYDSPETQTSGLGMVTGKPLPFIHFKFEPYKEPFTPTEAGNPQGQGSEHCPACGVELSPRP